MFLKCSYFSLTILKKRFLRRKKECAKCFSHLGDFLEHSTEVKPTVLFHHKTVKSIFEYDFKMPDYNKNILLPQWFDDVLLRYF